MTIQPLNVQPLRVVRTQPDVHHTAAPTQLDAALDAADWPRWTGRGDCPLELSDVTEAGKERARRLGVRTPDRCLTIGAMPLGDRLALIAELTETIPALAEVARLGLVHVETTPAGEVTYLLGLTLED